MKLLSFNESTFGQSLRAPVIGLLVSAAAHALLWVLWAKERPEPEPPETPAQVIEVALVTAQPNEAPAPPQPEVRPPPPPPPPPKPEKPPEKPAPKKPDKPKPKPIEKKQARPEPVREEAAVPAPPTTSASETAMPVPAISKPAAPAPQAFVAASYKDASLKNPPTRYPPVALERRWEGRVVLRVQVLPSGSAGEIHVESSSGHEILDDATVEQVKSWRFLPARKGEQPVASWVLVPIEYKLKH